MTHFKVSEKAAPALGDVRSAGPADTIWLFGLPQRRKDWPRYMDAIALAVSRGASVRWIR